jgi:hypothetical protein
MKKLIISMMLLICAVSLNAQTTWLENDSNLVGYYPFNENANDESGNRNNGIVNGAKLTTDRFGKLNSAYEFNGINNTIDIPNSYTLDFSNDKFTLSFWMKPTNKNINSGEFINKYSGVGRTVCGFMIYFDTNNIQYMYADEKSTGGWGGSKTFLSYLNETWVHVVITTDCGYDKLYINGNFISSTDNKHNFHIGSNNQNLRFGAGPTQNVGKYYNGCFDDIRIYNRAITIFNISSKKIIFNDTIYSMKINVDSIINNYNIISNICDTIINHNYINIDTITTIINKKDTIHNSILVNKNDIINFDSINLIKTITTNITISNIDSIFNISYIDKIISYTDIITIITYTNNTSTNITNTKSTLKIYPNPTSDIINVVGVDVKKIEIFNISGLKVLISNNNQIDVSRLKCGTYIIKIFGKNNETSTNKFIKN